MRFAELWPLRVPKADLLRVHYSPFFAPFKSDLDVLTNPRAANYPKYRDKYERLPQDTLRWQVITSTSVKKLPYTVLRERLRRRYKEAFREALKTKGFDKDGKVLDHSFEGSNARSLYGTLEVHIHGGLGFHLKMPVLVRQATLVVEMIQQECKQHPIETRRSTSGYYTQHYFERETPREKQSHDTDGEGNRVWRLRQAELS